MLVRAPGQSRGHKHSPVTNTANPSRRYEERNVARRNLWLPAFNRRVMNAEKTHTVAIATQVSTGTPMNFPPGWRDSLLVSEQVEKLQEEIAEKQKQANVDLNNRAEDISKASDLTKRSFTLNQGSLLVSQKFPVEISTADHLITVKPGAIAYLVNLGKELAVYKLSGKKADVLISSADGKNAYEVSKGTAIFLGESAAFAESKLAKFIDCKDQASMESKNGIHAYSASFSYLHALDACPQFQKCLTSKNADKHMLAEKLLKIGAAHAVAGF